MTAPGRIPCINPRCRRTAPAARYEPGTEIVCGKCWRSLPRELRDRRRVLERHLRRIRRRAERRLARGEIAPERAAHIGDYILGLLHRQWDEEIKRRFTAPEAPAGLENFLREAGLA